jgi:hypothetical protein
MTSFWEGKPTFPLTIHIGAGDDRVTVVLRADGTFDGDPAAVQAAMEKSRDAGGEAALSLWLLLRAMEA